MKKLYNLLIFVSLISGCALVPNGLKPKTELMKDPEYVKFMQEEQSKKDAETLRFLGLVNVKMIYLGDFGGEGYSNVVREKVRLALMDSSRFIVVENPAKADAILTGAAGVTTSRHQSISTNPYNGTTYVASGDSYSGFGVLRLVDVKSEAVIWNYEYQRHAIIVGSASNSVSDQIVEKLLEDTKSAEDLKFRLGQ